MTATLSDRNKPMLPDKESNAAPVRKSTWSKARINFWLDVLLALLFVALATVAAVLRFVFPTPTASNGWLLWGYDFDDVFRLQFTLLCVLGGGIVLHVMLHWSWVCGMLTRGNAKSTLRSDNGIQTLVGVIVLAVALHIIGLTVLAGQLLITKP